MRSRSLTTSSLVGLDEQQPPYGSRSSKNGRAEASSSTYHRSRGTSSMSDSTEKWNWPRKLRVIMSFFQTAKRTSDTGVSSLSCLRVHDAYRPHDQIPLDLA